MNDRRIFSAAVGRRASGAFLTGELRRLAVFAAFPLTAFAVWRVAHVVVLWLVGGDPVDDVMGWDGRWYRQIMEHGYSPVDGNQQPTAFFPFVPWLTRLVAAVVRHQGLAIGIVTNVGAAAAVVAVYGTAAEWRDLRTARWAVAFMLVFPVSYFLWSFYTEAIFIAATSGALWAHRREKHGVAVVCAGIAVMTRVLGVSVVIVLVGLRLLKARKVDRLVVLYASAALAVVPVLIAQWAEAGDSIAFASAQEAWERHLSTPWEPIWEHLRWLRDRGPTSVPMLDLTALGLALVAATYAVVRRRVDRWPLESWGWILLTVGPPLFTARLMSISRYTLAAWPIFILLAAFSLRLPAPLRFTLWAVSALSSVMVMRWFTLGVFVA